MTEAQARLLDTFKTFDSLCTEHGITYFAYVGTLLGTVRHQGFIPWDDDLDIQVPLPDYLKLLKLLKSLSEDQLSKLGVGYFYGLDERVSDMCFIRLHDNSSTAITDDALFNPRAWTGFYIDIVPLIGTPDDAEERAAFLDALNSNLRALWFNKLYNSEDSSLISKLKKEYRHLTTLYNYDTATTVCNADRIALESSLCIYPKSFFNKTVYLDFEDTKMPCPIEYDKQLTHLYGDYMTPPPKEKRSSHHRYFIDLNTPASEYRNMFASKKAGALLDYMREYSASLNREKFDILDRIPPLEDRIRLELRRVEEEVAMVEQLSNPSTRIATKQLVLALQRSLKRTTARLNSLNELLKRPR